MNKYELLITSCRRHELLNGLRWLLVDNVNDAQIMQKHLIFYIDLLGFAEAVNRLDETNSSSLVELVHNLTALRSNAACEEFHLENGTQFTVKPAITAFSDNLVISYPLEHLERVDMVSAVSTGLSLAQDVLGKIAATAMSLGFLIRGGATIGHLHHEEGEVIGPALVEAYKLESKTAIYPRIVVSRKIYQATNLSADHWALLKDHDGLTHLNYIYFMLMAGGGIPGEGFSEHLTIWQQESINKINNNITRYEAEEDWNKLAKWVWMKKHYENESARLPNFPS